MRLMNEHIYAIPQHIDWRSLDNLADLVVVPEVSLADLEEFSFSPADLRDEGHDVPEDEEEAFAYARSKFEESDEFDDWKQGFTPLMSVLWPCSIPSIEQAAAAFRRENLACTVVAGDVHGYQTSGIALTGGGMDLSDHIAAAYVLCGQTPPVSVIRAALQKQSTKMEEELLEAGERVAEILRNEADRLSEQLADRPGRQPRP